MIFNSIFSDCVMLFFYIFKSTNDLLCQKNMLWNVDKITFESNVVPNKVADNTTRKT